MLPGGGGGPVPGGASQACSGTAPGGWSPQTSPDRFGPAQAFKYSEVLTDPLDQCHALGGVIANSTFAFGLAFPSDPSRGITVTFTNGDACQPPLGNRSLRLWLICTPDVTNVPDNEPVTTSNSCDYDILITTAYGCPRECPIAPDPLTGLVGLCSNHGICDFDPALHNSRCFCYPGFSGGDCGTVQ